MIVKGKPLRLCIRQMRLIPKSRASFIIQTLEVVSNPSKFIVKRCMALMEILNQEQIDARLLIAENIKYMVDAPQQSCDIFMLLMSSTS